MFSIVIAGGFSSAQLVIEGLHYQNHSPICLDIRNGLISEINRIEKEPDASEAVCIAPDR
jgi:hypothetical protein